VAKIPLPVVEKMALWVEVGIALVLKVGEEFCRREFARLGNLAIDGVEGQHGRVEEAMFTNARMLFQAEVEGEDAIEMASHIVEDIGPEVLTIAVVGIFYQEGAESIVGGHVIAQTAIEVLVVLTGSAIEQVCPIGLEMIGLHGAAKTAKATLAVDGIALEEPRGGEGRSQCEIDLSKGEIEGSKPGLVECLHLGVVAYLMGDQVVEPGARGRQLTAREGIEFHARRSPSHHAVGIWCGPSQEDGKWTGTLGGEGRQMAVVGHIIRREMRNRVLMLLEDHPERVNLELLEGACQRLIAPHVELRMHSGKGQEEEKGEKGCTVDSKSSMGRKATLAHG